MPASSRRYPWVAFQQDREAGKDILEVRGTFSMKKPKELGKLLILLAGIVGFILVIKGM